MTVMHRRNPAQNMARFYDLVVQPSLFGDFLLIRRWGRIGTRGQTKNEWFAEEIQACRAHQVWLARKQRRGYQPVIERPE